ncbi:unnamed protein product, partial [Urochloa humidicola]
PTRRRRSPDPAPCPPSAIAAEAALPPPLALPHHPPLLRAPPPHLPLLDGRTARQHGSAVMSLETTGTAASMADRPAQDPATAGRPPGTPIQRHGRFGPWRR